MRLLEQRQRQIRVSQLEKTSSCSRWLFTWALFTSSHIRHDWRILQLKRRHVYTVLLNQMLLLDVSCLITGRRMMTASLDVQLLIPPLLVKNALRDKIPEGTCRVKIWFEFMTRWHWQEQELSPVMLLFEKTQNKSAQLAAVRSCSHWGFTDSQRQTLWVFSLDCKKWPLH